MDHIKHIANLITEDPDVLNKLSISEGVYPSLTQDNRPISPPSSNILWHYTSYAGLGGILRSGIRAIQETRSKQQQPPGYYFTALDPQADVYIDSRRRGHLASGGTYRLSPEQIAQRIFGDARRAGRESSLTGLTRWWVKVDVSPYQQHLRLDPALEDVTTFGSQPSWYLPISDGIAQTYHGHQYGDNWYLPAIVLDFGPVDLTNNDNIEKFQALQ